MESVKSKLELNFGTLKKQNAQESFTHRKLVGPIGQALDCCTAQINFVVSCYHSKAYLKQSVL